MTIQQIKDKIKELEEWLRNNLNHPDYSTILKDKHALEQQLEQLETNKKP